MTTRKTQFDIHQTRKTNTEKAKNTKNEIFRRYLRGFILYIPDTWGGKKKPFFIKKNPNARKGFFGLNHLTEEINKRKMLQKLADL